MALTISHGRRERINYAGATYHITNRCNNKETLIKDDLDFKKYRSVLKKCKEAYGFKLHGYSILHNHTHLLIRLETIPDISKIMHSINRWYARWYNEYYERNGHFWEDRFYGKLIKDDYQLLAVMRYLDLNPVRAGLCAHPADWEHSGARFYLGVQKDDLLDAPEAYINLGSSQESRIKSYSCIFPLT